jgi:uncharacterized protein YbjT (DUF2867 family)
MRVLVFGATGRTGQHFTALARRAGLAVHAAGRDPARLAALAGNGGSSAVDVLDPSAVEAAIRAASPDAIVSVIGGRQGEVWADEAGNIAIADAARRAGTRRLIQVSSLGCGDSRAHASERLLAAIGTVLEAKTRAEDHLRALDLDWTIIRPGGLTETAATGTGALYEDARVHGRIACADLAGLILSCLRAPHTVRKVLSAVDRASLSGPPDPHEVAVPAYPIPADTHQEPVS